MINSEILTIPAYTTRKFVRWGKLYQANTMYRYNFSPEDLALFHTGAIKLIPEHMCNYIVKNDTVFTDKKYLAGENIDVSIFEERTLMTLLKNNVIVCELKPEYIEKSDEELLNIIKSYNYIGISFKELSEKIGVDLDILKEHCKFKNATKKVVKSDIDTLIELGLIKYR